NELPLAPDELDGFTMTLLRLYAFRPAGAADAPPPASSAPAGGEVPPASVANPPAAKPAAKPRAEAKTRPVGDLPAESRAAAVPSGSLSDSSSDSSSDLSSGLSSDSPPESSSNPPPAEGSIGWHERLAALKLSGLARELGQHCELRLVDEQRVVLCLSPTHRHLQIKAAQDKLQQALSEHFGRPLRLSIELDEVSGETPAGAARRQRQERQEQAVASVEQDAFVREVIDMFDATLIESSIKPV
ncbi:MAG: hypothetical protein LBQ62_05060, partial [Candidatus Accumulibacter sp.]|nr:hypothetical protein [Accumulibacter sp.]